jgi:hypothetical protein
MKDKKCICPKPLILIKDYNYCSICSNPIKISTEFVLIDHSGANQIKRTVYK